MQEAYVTMTYYDADVGTVIINTLYPNGTKDLANKAGIILWNRYDLIKFIAKYNVNSD